MFCGNCGKLIEEESKFCTGCGQKVTPIGSNSINESSNVDANVNNNVNPIDMGNTSNKINYEDEVVCKTQDKINVWLVILGFLIPIVGLILFLVLRKDTPKKANAIGIAALIGIVFGFVIGSIIFAIFVIYAVDLYNIDYINDYNDDYYYYENYDNDYEYEYDYDIKHKLDKLENEFNKYYNNKI